MQAHTHSLDQVFAPVGQIAVPLFQRNYVWEAEKHCLPLWEDIQRLADRYFVGDQSKPHFLGTIVLEQLPFPMGSVPIRQIIDGQQRLITLQILMAAARDLCLERGLENIAERFSSLTKNQLVGKQSTEEQFKVWPTNADRNHYRTIMESGSLATLKRSYRATGGSWIPNDRIPATYLSFYHWITDWIDQDKSKQEEKFSALYNVLQFRVSMVIIDLDPSDDAQVIFETLNARGTPLLPSDLIKNYLLRLSEKDGLAVKQVYEKYWMPIDQDRKFWEEKIAQGRYFRPRIDTFFQYYLTLRINDEIQSSDLFNIFRDDVNRSGLSPEEHLASIAEYASIFREWYRSLEGREKLFFYRLATLETTTVMPFLLELFRQVNNRDDRIPILADLESYLVRRAICRLTAKNYNRLFLELLQLCRKVGFHHSVVRHFLESQNGDISIWPNDTEFKQAWKNYPIYSPYSLRRLRMILEALEVKKREKWSESKEIPVQLTVEHLLPQSWKQNWPLLEATEESIAKRNQLLQTIGNLTLLTDKLNPSISNGSWPYKTEKIGKFSVLLLNRNLPENWSETEILKRADDLFTLAQCIWPKMSSPPCVEPIEYRNMDLFLIGRVSSQDSNSNKTPIPNVPFRWTHERLVEYFKDLPNEELVKRQTQLLNWAIQNAFFKPLPKGGPRYGLQSKWGLLVIIYANGQLFVRLGYLFDEINTRDHLVEGLNELGLYQLKPEQLAIIRDGKYSIRTIEELSDEQFKQLKKLLETYCKQMT